MNIYPKLRYATIGGSIVTIQNHSEDNTQFIAMMETQGYEPMGLVYNLDGKIPTEHPQHPFDLVTALPATDQEAFDFVLYTLLRQGQRSVATGTSVCQYRNPIGLKCAVGHMIPDDQYNPELEGRTTSSEMVMDAIDHQFVDVNKWLLHDMQRAHDDTAYGHFKSDFIYNMKRTATNFNLEYKDA